MPLALDALRLRPPVAGAIERWFVSLVKVTSLQAALRASVGCVDAAPRYRGPRRDAQGARPNFLRSHEDGGRGRKSVSVWRLAKSVRDGRSDNGIPWSARDASSIFDENRYLPGPRLRTRRGRLRKKSPRCLPPGAESLRAARRLAIWSSLTRCSTACATSRSPFAATARATAHPQLESSGSKSILSSRRGAAARLLLARREVASPRYAATR